MKECKLQYAHHEIGQSSWHAHIRGYHIKKIFRQQSPTEKNDSEIIVHGPKMAYKGEIRQWASHDIHARSAYWPGYSLLHLHLHLHPQYMARRGLGQGGSAFPGVGTQGTSLGHSDHRVSWTLRV